MLESANELAMQRELFSKATYSDSVPAKKKTSEPPSASPPMRTLGMDKFLIMIFLMLVSYVVVFSWGVDRGQRKSSLELKAQLNELRDEIGRIKNRLLESSPAQLTEASGTPELTFDLEPPVELVLEPVKTASVGAEAPSMAEETEASEAGRGRSFTVQLVTYTNPGRAEKRLEVLRERGYDAFLIPSGDYYQVCIERLSTMDVAQAVKAKIQRETGLYADAYIRTVSL